MKEDDRELQRILCGDSKDCEELSALLKRAEKLVIKTKSSPKTKEVLETFLVNLLTIMKN